MRSLTAQEAAALAAPYIKTRDFLWVQAKDRATGAVVGFGFWTGAGSITTTIVDAVTGASGTRTFYGGAVESVGPIPQTCDIAVRTVSVGVNPLDPYVASMFRVYDITAAPVQIYRGLFTPGTEALVSAPHVRFVGFVSETSVVTPEEGGVATMSLECESNIRELRRPSPLVRSDASQRLRNASDGFYKYTTSVGEWEINWGTVKK